MRLAAVTQLAAYLTVFVTAPAWHSHGETGAAAADEPARVAAHAGCGHRHGPVPPAGGEDAASRGCDHGDRDHAPGEPDCGLCDLLAQCVLPVTAPAVADLGEPLPAFLPPAAADRRAVFLRTHRSRGPPRG